MAKKKVAKKTPVKKVVKKKPAKKVGNRSNTGGTYLGKSPLIILLYGPPGVGKTSFASYFPRPGFIIDPQETGINDLLEYKQVQDPVWVKTAKNWQDLMDKCADCIADDSIQSLILDSATGFEKFCFHHHCNEHFGGDWSSEGFMSYYAGPEQASKTDWVEFQDMLDTVQQAGKNVILVAHSYVKPYNNPEGPDYDRYKPYLDNRIWSQCHRWAKVILFYNYVMETDTKKKGGAKKKVNTAVDRRMIYTEWSPAYDAKNRFGLTPAIDAGDDGKEAYEAFEDAMKQAGK